MSNIKTIELEKRPLTDDTEYSYCIDCLKKAKAAGQQRQSVPKLIYFKTGTVETLPDGTVNKWWDESWYCVRCQRHLTTEDFVKAYTKERV